MIFFAEYVAGFKIGGFVFTYFVALYSLIEAPPRQGHLRFGTPTYFEGASLVLVVYYVNLHDLQWQKAFMSEGGEGFHVGES